MDTGQPSFTIDLCTTQLHRDGEMDANNADSPFALLREKLHDKILQ